MAESWLLWGTFPATSTSLNPCMAQRCSRGDKHRWAFSRQATQEIRFVNKGQYFTLIWWTHQNNCLTVNVTAWGRVLNQGRPLSALFLSCRCWAVSHLIPWSPASKQTLSPQLWGNIVLNPHLHSRFTFSGGVRRGQPLICNDIKPFQLISVCVWMTWCTVNSQTVYPRSLLSLLSAVASKTKTSCYIMKWVKSVFFFIGDVILYPPVFRLNWKCKIFFFFSVPSICNQWDWEDGRHEQERAWTWCVSKYASSAYMCHQPLTSQWNQERPRTCGCTDDVRVFLKGPWRRKLWDPSSLKTSLSRSGSPPRCSSQTVSVVTEIISDVFDVWLDLSDTNMRLQ